MTEREKGREAGPRAFNGVYRTPRDSLIINENLD